MIGNNKIDGSAINIKLNGGNVESKPQITNSLNGPKVESSALSVENRSSIKGKGSIRFAANVDYNEYQKAGNSNKQGAIYNRQSLSIMNSTRKQSYMSSKFSQ